MSMYTDIVQGLNEAIESERGNLSLRTRKVSIAPVTDFKADEIKEIRKQLGLTQAFFAGFMGVSQKTVEAWEAGSNRPQGPARRMLSIIKDAPEIVGRYVER